jgi:hypothetical protein
MHSESVKLALYDIRDNILLAGGFVEGLTSQEFGESRLHLYAVTRSGNYLGSKPPVTRRSAR